MRTVESLNEIKVNMETLDKYLASKKDPEYTFAINLIRRGTCFIAMEKNGKYRFYPSRFIGYLNNGMNEHLNNRKKDGRVTNPAISEIIGKIPTPNPVLENLYHEYCESLGFIANEKGAFGVERKYWEVKN
jgi:hypothetical protein